MISSTLVLTEIAASTADTIVLQIPHPIALLGMMCEMEITRSNPNMNDRFFQ
jgi:hypothetical protein